MADDRKWTEFTAEEKREARIRKWLSAPGIEFNSPEARQKYIDGITRVVKAINLEEPDRVPVQIPSGSFPAYYAGYDLKRVMYDIDAMKASWMKFVTDFDCDTHGATFFFPGKVLDLLDYKTYKWPGHGLGDDAVMVQFDEKEYMGPDEYDAFILNPADFIIRRFLPRNWGAFAPMATLSSLSSFQSIAYQSLGMASMPDFMPLFKAIAEASKAQIEWLEAIGECSRATQAMGYPTTQGGMALSPFDTIADILRGTRGSSMDMYRRPEQLMEATEKIVHLTLQSILENADKFMSPFVFIPMHKGDDNFMSEKQFEKFYWPPFRKLLLGLIAEGLIPSMVVDGTYNRRLEYIKDLPRASVIWTFEKTDMALAKKVLGGHACIAGNITGSLLYTGTPEDVKKYCRWLIDTCGPGGGYILSMGISVDKVDPANLQAIIETAKEYGVYGK
jgi:uroporphyrinogen-III decarboxylase